MAIKKIFKFITKNKKKALKNKHVIISGFRAKSTLGGRKKIEQLKKIGKEKRAGNIK